MLKEVGSEDEIEEFDAEKIDNSGNRIMEFYLSATQCEFKGCESLAKYHCADGTSYKVGCGRSAVRTGDLYSSVAITLIFSYDHARSSCQVAKSFIIECVSAINKLPLSCSNARCSCENGVIAKTEPLRCLMG